MELVEARCISETEGDVMKVGCARWRSSVERVGVVGVAWKMHCVGLQSWKWKGCVLAGEVELYLKC